jgi:molybdenum cofactor synthesis domain-containing protein
MYTAAIVTVSDRGSAGEREDRSGPAIEVWCEKMGFPVVSQKLVPDERKKIAEILRNLSDEGISLILTTGGTGMTDRDVTPEATGDVIDKEVPGFAETMRWRSLQVTDHAMLSRATSGIRKHSLIINLPGSPKAVRENLSFIEKAIPHALELIMKGSAECGSD